MRAPLTVRISDGSRDQQVTRFVKGLRFTKTAPGGHHSASVSIDAPEGLFGDLGPADRLFIYDGRNARTVWDGYVENPGRVTVAGGARYDLSAMGGVVLASDNAKPVVFRTTDVSGSQWVRNGDAHPDATIEVDEAIIPGEKVLKALIPPGTSLMNGGPKSATVANRALRSTGQRIHSASVVARGGRSGGAYFMQLVADTTVHYEFLAASDTPLQVTPGGATVAGAAVFLDLQMTLEDPSVPENTWVAFRDFVLTPTLLKPSGADATPIDLATVRAHEVVGHVVGALLPQVDGMSAGIEASTFQIENLAYLSAVKPFEILDDLSLYEPNFLWEILESNWAGKHRFNYRAWPTSRRYEISGRDFTESGGEADLCNRIVLSWTDEAGTERTTVRTATVAALGSRVKDAEPISLPEGQGSLTNAQRIGDEVLAALNTPARSGTAVIRRPIFDRLTGMMVMPWEIEPGHLVRVRDMGVDLRLTEMTYDDADCTASLTLGTPTLTLAQRLARLQGRRASGRPTGGIGR